MDARPVSFLAFFVAWARLQGWKIPMLHVRICHWLETCDAPERALMVFRGAAKSTIYAVYKAWKLYRNRQLRSLVWSADGPTAGMLTADVMNVLRNHPLTGGMLQNRSSVLRFWVTGARDARNASMRAVGVKSNATGARADDVDFDDVEVPGNIETPESRLKLRQRISESVHIAVPGGQKTFIGTPHTHDSIYQERIAGGAAVLKSPLFEHAVRYTDTAKRTRYEFKHPIGPDGIYVMTGIYKGARLLTRGLDFKFEDGHVIFSAPPGVVVDIFSKCAWPERFTRNEVEKRRRETRTLNAWDSQYHLEAKPLEEIRLDPEAIIAYDCEPVFRTQNKILTMWLGAVQITGCSLRWDPSSGKVGSDVSAAVLDLRDAAGRHYWHRALELSGKIAETSEDGKTVTGGQVMQLVDLIAAFKIPRITVETNGIGGFAPDFLKMALKQRRPAVRCAVVEVDAVQNKNLRILEALEPLIQSGMLWAHVSVLMGPLWDTMKDWNAVVKNQPDDLLDAGAGAVTDQPARIGAAVRFVEPDRDDNWRPSTGVFEATLEG